MNEEMVSGSLWWVGPGCWAWSVTHNTSTGKESQLEGVAGTKERANEEIEQAKATLAALAAVDRVLAETAVSANLESREER